MCRLFALHAGDEDVTARFWLLDAPDSLAVQSERNADGYGLGALSSTDGLILIKNPVKASAGRTYERVAHAFDGSQFLAHIRYASNGEPQVQNTHPFAAGGRLFAHNGVLGDLDKIDESLGDYSVLVTGETDSERYFAFLTKAIQEAGGDIEAGITKAVCELAAGYELYAINFLLATRGHIWAFRYPEQNELYILDRAAGGPGGGDALEHQSEAKTLTLKLDEGSDRPVVVIASERMDDDPGWEEVGVGELVHIGPDLSIERKTIVEGPPAKLLQLHGKASTSQTASTS